MGDCKDCEHYPCFWIQIGLQSELANLCYDYRQGIEEADRVGLIDDMPMQKVYIKGKKDGQEK